MRDPDSVSSDLLALEEADLRAEEAELAPHLFLHEVEAHGQQCQTDEQVQGAQHHPALRGRLQAEAGHVVAEADRAERDEAEVEADEVVPLGLDECEEHGAEGDVGEHQQKADIDRNVNRAVVAGVQSPAKC